MATFTKLKLSGSTDGMPIKVVATATLGTNIHTAHATSLDEIFAWVTNPHTADIDLTVEWGGATDPDNLLVKSLTIPAKSPPIPIATGQLLTNSKVFTAFASVANKLVFTGYVNRIG
jgi:hypothetical protein